MTNARSIGLAMSLLLFCACDGEPSSTDGGDEADAGRLLDAGAQRDGGSRRDSGEPGEDAGEPERRTVFFGAAETTTSSVMHAIVGGAYDADFAAGIRAGDPIGCEIETRVGDCFVLGSCETPVTLDAGALGVAIEGDEISVSRRPAGDYGYTGDGSLFDPGDELIFRGAGATAPAFELSVTAPETIVADVPSSASRTEDYVVTWTPRAGSRVQFTWVAAVSGDFIQCVVGSEAGSITVDQTLVSRIEPTASSLAGVTVYNIEELAIDDFDVFVLASEASLETVVVE
jgi:hypothetical protein